MTIGLVSDTHGHKKLVDNVADFLSDRNVDRIIHTGDVTEPQHIDALLELDVPVHLVYGNCDFNKTGFKQAQAHSRLECSETEETLELEGQTVSFTHGHYDRILNRLISENPDYVIHGHTHDRRDQRFEGTRIINPGAVKPPEPSFAILDPEEDTVTFHDLEQ